MKFRVKKKFYCHKCGGWVDHAIFGEMAVCLTCGDEYPVWVKLRQYQVIKKDERISGQ